MDVSPEKQNLDAVFGNTTFHIDFYQRDYRWSTAAVDQLLDDVFFKFRDGLEDAADMSPSPEVVAARFPWYYLSTYVTNTVEGRVYLVDGQQRLTTLTLVLIKLVHLSGQFESELTGWLSQKVAGQSGFEKSFWMNHVGHTDTLEDLLNEGTAATDSAPGTTSSNLVANYKFISEYLDTRLKSKRDFEFFCLYFLNRLVLIELDVQQTDVPMVFEVINDRGVSLRPYEILKGKLLGQIDKLELEQLDLNTKWEHQASAINAIEEDATDDFFRQYLRAKFADVRSAGQKFDGPYHHEMFSKEMNAQLGLQRNPGRVKQFLEQDFMSYSDTYIQVRNAAEDLTEDCPHAYYLDLLRIDVARHLSIAACGINDLEQSEKIAAVASETDRLYSLLQLQGAWSSTEFADAVYRIGAAIRERPVDEYRSAFDNELISLVSARRGVAVTAEATPDPFTYANFKHTGGNLNTEFRRYFFARVDQFLAQETNMEPVHSMRELVKNSGAVTGFHLEHILSWNDENRALFGDDQDAFENERNRLGGLLLLKGKDNISSSNELYKDKLRTYANTLLWNATLREDTYKSNADLNALKDRLGLDLKPYDVFGPDELEARHRLLFDISKQIWA